MEKDQDRKKAGRTLTPLLCLIFIDQMHVHLVVFDILGRQVELLLDGQQQPGSYEVEWNASQYPSGIYFCRLEAGVYSKTLKMNLVR